MPHGFPRGKGLSVVDSVVNACEGIISKGLQLATKSLSGKTRDAAARIRRAAIEALEQRTFLSATYFVATNGSDNAAGTISAPFRTIQHAANLALAGDHVEIRGGTYHETVAPAHSGTASSPIVFEAYNGESVTVSGADRVSNFASYGSSIYDASMPWTLGAGNDQVFVDGQLINYARWPNTSLDVSHPSLAHAQGVTLNGSSATLYDSALNQPAGYWNGATIHITPGQAWIAQTGTVTGSGTGWLTFNYQPLDSYELPAAGNAYYLTGLFRALDSAGEWYRDGSGTLYVRTPASDNANNHDIEAKHRLYAFDVSGRSDITIQNLNIFAATINSDANSAQLVVNHIGAYYTGEFLLNPSGWNKPNNSGLVLRGSGDVLENSTIAYSAGDGVYVTGSGSTIANNTIHDIDYSASDSAAIRVLANSVTISHNSIYNTGRSAILHQGSGLQIVNNLITGVGLQTTEAGGIYDVNTNGGGTVIANNTVYGFHSAGYGSTGIFLDNNSSGYIIHNNIVSDVDSAMKLNQTCRSNSIYNNNLAGSQFAINSDQKGDWNGTTISSNAISGRVLLGSGANYSSNGTSASGGIGAGSISSGASSSASSTPPRGSAADSSGPAGSISGTFFYDSNADGVWNSGESVSPSWLVYIDANNDGVYDSGDTEIRANTAGQFTFGNLAAGTYHLRAATAAGWRQTSPANGAAAVVTLASGQNATNVNFGVLQGSAPAASAPGSISGAVFYDTNGNGVWNSGEGASPAWLVYIDSNNNGRYDSGEMEVRGDSSGRYSFAGLAAGNYIVRLASASGWRQTSPVNGGAQSITVGSGQAVGNVNFGVVQGSAGPATISGTFVYDTNANGVWNSGESSVPYWLVYIDSNNDGRYDAGDREIRGDASGNFAFTGLAAGTYVIRAEQAAGWQQTSPSSNGGRVITVSAGQTVSSVDFFERRV